MADGDSHLLSFEFSKLAGDFTNIFVDQVSLEGAIAPGVCTFAPEVFVDGFESGTTGAWSATHP